MFVLINGSIRTLKTITIKNFMIVKKDNEFSSKEYDGGLSLSLCNSIRYDCLGLSNIIGPSNWSHGEFPFITFR